MTSATLTSGLPDPQTQAQFYDGVLIKRALAWVVDVVLIALLCVLILPFTAFTGVFFLPFLMLVVGFLYRWFTLAGKSATWGMRIMSIEFRDHRGGRFDSSAALLHTLGYSVSVAVAPLQLISVIMMAVTARGQGLTDHLMGTAPINRPV